jgi:hypothetical protein
MKRGLVAVSRIERETRGLRGLLAAAALNSCHHGRHNNTSMLRGLQ